MTTAPPTIMRLPPSDIGAELAVLGSLILAGHQDPIFDEIKGVVGEADFYSEDNRILFSALCEMKTERVPIDAVTLRAHLEQRGALADVGGSEYLGKILGSVPSAAHGPHYARIVREAGCKREMIRIANLMLRDGYGDDEPTTGSEIGNRASAAIATALNATTSLAFSSSGDVLAEAYEQLEKGGAPLIPTGFRDLDAAIGGIGIGEMMVIGARPSMGKSTIARQIAMRVGCHYPVAFISLEESTSKIGRNWFSACAGIDNNRLRRGSNLLKEEWDALANSIERLGRANVFVSTRAFKLQAIRSVASLLVAKHGVKLVIVDYLQKIQVEGKDRFEKVTNASQELSALWKELGVAGLVLAQLKREVERRDDKRPSMSDLRESGQIEQDADCIIFLHREDYYGVSDPNYITTGDAELIVAKMRDAERGRTIILKSELNYQRFADVEQRQDLANAFG